MSLLSLVFVIRGKKQTEQTKANFLETLLWIFFECLATSALFLDAVYWILLDNPVTYYTISTQAVNTVLVLVELYLNRISIFASHIVFPILFGLLYLCYTAFYHYYYHDWLYYFLDWNNNDAPAIYTFLIIGLFISGAIMKLLSNLKTYLVIKQAKYERLVNKEEDPSP
jgi:hypothetical protein